MITKEHKAQLDRIIAKGLESVDVLSEWEYDYLMDWADRVDEDHLDIRVSDKQQRIFDRIEEKLQKAGDL